jgi:hypothetical protein
LINMQNDIIKTILKIYTSQKDIINMINYSICQVKCMKKNIINWGSVNASKFSKADRSSMLIKESIDIIHFLYISLDFCSISDNFL